MLTGGQCGKFQVLVELAEATETRFVCPGGNGRYGQVVQGVKLPTHSCVSVALAHSCVRVAFACGCVSAALAHSCVRVAFACGCVSVALAHSCVRVAFACGCVGAALPHSCVSVPLAYGCVSVASAHSCVSANGIGVGCLFACGAREKKNVTFGCVIKHLQYCSLCLVHVSVLVNRR